MRVLAIESSCDETGVAIYDSEQGLVADVLHSQVDLHARYGGVVPELASRDHLQRIIPLLQEALGDSSLKNIDVFAYTQGPGLAGALLVGASMATSLAFALQKPLLGVHHLEGHLLSPLLAKPDLQFPFLALLVSGGHTQLIHVHDLGRYTLLGETLDDAAGEAFDKTAKLLGLGYPGGALLSALALQGEAGRYTLPKPMLHSNNLDFSFSGLKTAVLHTTKRHPETLTEAGKAHLARDFVEAMVTVLTSKCIAAIKQTKLSTLVVAGGVGANQQLRLALNNAAAKLGFSVHYPPLALCTDNAAMIALAASLRLKQNPQLASCDYAIDVKPRWSLF